MDVGVPGGSVMDGGVMDGGVNGGGEAGTAGEAGVAKQWRGERRSSSVSSSPRSNSASFRLFLSRLAGGGSATGGEGGGGVGGGGVAVFSEGVPSQVGAAATGDDGCGHNCSSLAVVVAAARPRLARRRRLFPAVAADVAEADRVHMMMTLC